MADKTVQVEAVPGTASVFLSPYPADTPVVAATYPLVQMAGLVHRFTVPEADNLLGKYFAGCGGEAGFLGNRIVEFVAGQDDYPLVTNEDLSAQLAANRLTLLTIKQQSDTLISKHGGPGVVRRDLTITSTAGPVDGAEVWVTLDIDGAYVTEGPYHTDTFGKVAFHLSAGTYYIWTQRSGINFPNPTTMTFA